MCFEHSWWYKGFTNECPHKWLLHQSRVRMISKYWWHLVTLLFDTYCNEVPSVQVLERHETDQRKFRSETSDNMDSWKAEVRRVRRDKIRRKKMQMREKIGKSRFTVFFQWFVAPEGRKVGSLKRRVRSQLARWDMKKCTPLWREAHFQVKMDKTLEERTTFGSWDVEKCTPLWREAHFEVKMCKTHHGRITFGSCDVEKVHAVVARSTFWSQNVQNTPMSDHFWKFRCRKSARRCGAKYISKSKVLKTDGLGPLLEVQMSKKCRKKVHAVVARSTFL